jgi:hypothetical protein
VMVPVIAEWLAVFSSVLTGRDGTVLGTDHPPDVPGFVELVLHRSLRSHAPPFAA